MTPKQYEDVRKGQKGVKMIYIKKVITFKSEGG